MYRWAIRPAGEESALYADVFNEATNDLVEAKASASRRDVRMAMGQLADYGRYVPTAKRVVLLPERPALDLIALLNEHSIRLLVPEGHGFGYASPDLVSDSTVWSHVSQTDHPAASAA